MIKPEYLKSKAQLKNEKRTKREQEWDEQNRIRREEVARKAALTMWERIEEVKDIDDVKEILHELAIHVGLEEV